MSSQKDEDEYIAFTGENAEEAEDFIHAVNRRAWAAGKLDDDTWTAKFAYVCFTKKALRWYEELDKETRNDWTLLRRAILARYATPSHSPSIFPSSAPASTSVPASLEFIPAATPSAAKPVRRGRIRVDRHGNGSNAYISQKSAGPNEIHCIVETDVSNACVFEADIIRRTITFQDGVSRLIVRAYQMPWSLEPRKEPGKPKGSDVEYGALFQAPLNSSCGPVWTGLKWDDVWSIGPDGKVIASLTRQDGSLYTLEVLVPAERASTIYLLSDAKAFVECFGSMLYKAATLIFEPLP